MTIQTIYNVVASYMLERGGFTLGLITVPQFLEFYLVSLFDFLDRTGLAKTMLGVQQIAGQSMYVIPDYFNGPDETFSMGSAIQQSSDTDIANSNYSWTSKTGTPRLWLQSTMALKNIQIFPAPTMSGNAPVISSAPGMYGTISSVTAGADISIASTGPFYGTIAADSGSAALVLSGPMYGTIGNLVTGQSNLLFIGSASVYNLNPTLSYNVEWLPDSFALYIGYGILSKIYGCDGETKDELKRRYCQARYDEGIELGKALMEEEIMDEQSALAV